MKKKILYSLASLFFMVAMIFNFQYDNENSDLKNANLEALTISYSMANAKETTPGGNITCYSVASNCAFFGCTVIRHCGAQSPTSSCQGMNSDSWSSPQNCADIQGG